MLKLYGIFQDASHMPAEIVVLPIWTMFENDLPYTHTAL